MLLRVIGIFIVTGIVTIISSQLSGIHLMDLVILALALSPFILLQANLNNQRKEISGSIFFSKYIRLFQLCALFFGIALFLGLYYYGKTHGLLITVIYFLIASVIQGAYYTLIKLTVPMGEIYLIPLETIGLILFYSLIL